jgi:hypothetical protein
MSLVISTACLPKLQRRHGYSHLNVFVIQAIVIALPTEALGIGRSP